MKKIDYYEICNQKLKYLNYSEKTIKIYIFYIEQFLKSLEVSPSRITSNDFQFYLNNYKFISISQQNQVINSIRFLYKEVLGRKYDKVSFTRPRSEKRLPKVIDSDFIIEKLSKIENIKHRTILTLTYSVGLRVSEIVNLKIDDIDSERMIIYIRNGKGRKDRIVPLSKNVLLLINVYKLKYNPIEHLFNGQKSNKYSIGSCQKIYKKYIDQKTSIHTLRHSCFTNLLESDVNLRTIQKIAGHSSSKTTEIYTHVSNNILSKVKLPI